MKTNIFSIRPFVFAALAAIFILAVPRSIYANDKEESAPAKRLGTETCLGCHDGYDAGIGETKHGILFKKQDGEAASRSGCESCHGPGGAHLEDPTTGIVSFDPKRHEPLEIANACLACHEKGAQKFWRVSDHADERLSCVSCHQVHKRSKTQLKKTQTELCAGCHAEKAAEIKMPGRHPVKEGKVACSQCHNPHQNLEMAYEGSSITFPCADCHQEKAGPFVNEHDPVTESCLICHQTHGSANKQLLKFKQPSLCMQCHSDAHLFNNQIDLSSGRVCTDCHTSQHGSNADEELLR